MKRNLRFIFLILLMAYAGSQHSFAQQEPKKEKKIIPLSDTLTVKRVPVDSSKVIVTVQTESKQVPPEIQRITRDRNTSLFFHQTLLYISEPSTIAGVFTSLNKNLERNPNLQKKPFLLDANFQVPIGIGGKRFYKRLKIRGVERFNFVNSFHVIPQFRIRIFRNDTLKHNDRSLPVRTPSYIPAIVWNFGSLSGWQKTNSKKWYYFGKVFHHSNGQDGAEFTPTGAVNTYNGNFGENIAFEVGSGFYFTIDSLRRDTTLNGEIISSRYHRYSKFGFEFHPRKFTNEAYLKYKVYGRHRLNWSYGWKKVPRYRTIIQDAASGDWYPVEEFQPNESSRIEMHASLIVDPKLYYGNINSLSRAGFSRRINIYATYYRKFPNTATSGMFIQGGYYGSDPYNVYFQERQFFVRAGLSFGFFNFGNVLN